jgi:hypothetical protein
VCKINDLHAQAFALRAAKSKKKGASPKARPLFAALVIAV